MFFSLGLLLMLLVRLLRLRSPKSLSQLDPSSAGMRVRSSVVSLPITSFFRTENAKSVSEKRVSLMLRSSERRMANCATWSWNSRSCSRLRFHSVHPLWNWSTLRSKVSRSFNNFFFDFKALSNSAYLLSGHWDCGSASVRIWIFFLSSWFVRSSERFSFSRKAILRAWLSISSSSCLR